MGMHHFSPVYTPHFPHESQGEADALAFWEVGERLVDFSGAIHDEQWERNETVPIVHSLREPTLYEPLVGHPPSPTPSFARYFEGQCLCDRCSPNGPIHYSPAVEAEKHKLYDAWIKKKREEFEQRRLKNRKVLALPLELRRKRAILVVQGVLGLSEDERREYDEDSYKRWWEFLQVKFEAEEDSTRPDNAYYRWSLPTWYSFCEY